MTENARTKYAEMRDNAPKAACPECGKEMPVAWFGSVNDVYICEKCPLLKVKEKNKTEQRGDK